VAKERKRGDFIFGIRELVLRHRTLFLVLLLAVFINFVGVLPNIRHPDEPPLHDDSILLVVNAISKGDFDPHTYKYGTINYFIHAIVYAPFIVSGYVVYALNTYVTSSFSSKPISFWDFYVIQAGHNKILLFGLGRAITSFFGVGNVYLTYILGKKLFDKRVGLLAALFLTIAPLHARDSHYITTDVPFLFFLLLSLVFLVQVQRRGKANDYALAGLFSGISIAIRFFPVVAVPYGVVMLMVIGRQKRWFYKMIVGFVFVFAGLFIGVPFLFLDPNGPELFMKDLTKYALPWYSTPLSIYVFSLGSYLFSGDESKLLPISSVWPKNFRPYLASYIFFKGYGVFGSLISLVGLFLVLVKRPKNFLLLSPLPIFVFVYSTYYLKVRYERVMIPILPFMALFAAFAIISIATRLEKRYRTVLTGLILIVSLTPFYMSVFSSLSCAGTPIYTMSEKFIENSIEKDASIAHLPSVSFPGSPEFGGLKLIEMMPNNLYSLDEVRTEGAQYAFINAFRLEYDTYYFFDEFFVADEQLYKNTYAYLAIYEYETRSELLHVVEKNSMCENTRIYYYKLPSRIDSGDGENILDSEDLGDFWTERRYNSSVADSKASVKEGRLELVNSGYSLISPRIHSQMIPVEAGKVYTFKARVKASRDFSVRSAKPFLRMDFFGAKPGNSLLLSLRKDYLMLQEGSTPLYFEHEIRIGDTESHDLLLGRVVALSSRMEAKSDEWRDLEVTARAPANIRSVVLSVQADSAGDDIFYIDKLELRESLD